MYAVIFRAEISELDDSYAKVASRLRDLATEKYGCIEFAAVTEGNREIAISYWESLEQLNRWKKDLEHLQAQKRGKSKWYKTYQIQIVEVIRSYSNKT